jgi:predicted nicotinamide N-methyase
LVSLLLNNKLADISATDIHPEAGEFLAQNTSLNNGKVIPFERASWSEFDLVIGSDLLYEKESINNLASFIDSHARIDSNIVIIDPGRGNSVAFYLK